MKVDTFGIHAFYTEKQQMFWSTNTTLPHNQSPMHLTSVTTDTGGHLFGVDENNHSVQMFSAINGRYLRYLIVDEFVIGHPLYVNWCENTSTLILTHLKGNVIYISFFKIFL